MDNVIILPSAETDPIVLHWAAGKLQMRFPADLCRAIAYVNESDILGAVVYHSWTPHSCELSIATDRSKRWATRRFITAIYKQAFVEFDKSRIHFTVDPTNTDSMRLQEKLGHKKECVLDDAAGEGKPLVLWGLTRKDWLRGRYAQL